MSRHGGTRPAVAAAKRRRVARSSRGGATFLLEQTVTAGTGRRYRNAAIAFYRWALESGEDARDETELDNLLVDYFHELFEDERGVSVAACTLHGVVWLHPELKFQLPRAAQAVRGWSKMRPGTSYPPLTWELAIAIGLQLARAGQHRHGVGVLLAFDCFLRVSELVGLYREDVVDDRDVRIGFEHRGLLLRLRKTKTGSNKTVAVLDEHAQALLRQLVRDTKPGERLFPFTTDHFRRAMKRSCAELGLSGRYVPHSLRHGGATRYSHVLGWLLEDVMQRGRWASTKSARLYIQSGPALLMSMTVPPRLAATAVLLSKDPVYYFNLLRASVTARRTRH